MHVFIFADVHTIQFSGVKLLVVHSLPICYEILLLLLEQAVVFP